MSRALELYTRICAGGAAEVERMITDEVVEELFLDYKRSSTALPARKLAEDDRKNFAKAVGGFANSEGGVIIWGVDCRQTVNGDVPTKAVPITNPTALKTLLDGALGSLTLPSHSAVESVALARQNGDGFVITYIPMGTHVPYQTLYPRNEYYIRAGFNFLPTPHSVLAGMFGRAPQPNVVPSIALNPSYPPHMDTPGDAMRLALHVSALNKGRGIAEDIFSVADTVVPEPSRVSYTTEIDNPTLQTVVEPGSFSLFAGTLKLPPHARKLMFCVYLDVLGEGDHIVTVSFGSKGGPGAAKEIVFPADLLRDARNCLLVKRDSSDAQNQEFAARLRQCVGT